ncbi:PREDICTED: transcription termination factor MTERF8, chloroplastic [Tarenaya hassleriana]|uniref:transcription termination factor MTERF8, chloroplastic n=1 Tax=Tarenaya hassleriana TaxID=28532 RepID=UPI00053C12D2|nr:PREDICTED: transcription termination factor MTERF8, chloroplastic [Tarenaya hassleriana]
MAQISGPRTHPIKVKRLAIGEKLGCEGDGALPLLLHRLRTVAQMAVTVPQYASALRLLYSTPSSWKTPSSTGGRTIPKPLFFSLQSQSSPPAVISRNPRGHRHSHSFTISYLVDSCGLSPEHATVAAQKLHLDSPDRPDAVLALLRDHGFSRAQISSLVKKRPLLLLASVESVLLPKIRFLLSIGISEPALARALCSNPTILTRSLTNQIIPSYNFLKSVLLSDEKIVAALRRTTWIFLADHNKSLVPNIDFLSEMGVPEKCVKLLVTHFPEAVMQRNEYFRRIAEQAKEMGFDPKKSTFVLAIHTLSGKANQSTWEKCFEVYKRWGWSEDDIMRAFKKHPHCMMLSERKINRSMEYLVKEMGWEPRRIVQCPLVLFFSLEKRIIPRCSVIRVLVSKGLVNEDWSLASVLAPVEDVFLDKFVTKYAEQVPELMLVYRGKIHRTQPL